MIITFRVDDIFLNNSIFERQLFEVFVQNRIPVTLGVIPFNENGVPHVKKLAYCVAAILDDENFQIAVHGYSHKRNESWGEFYGLPPNEQRNLLILSKKHIETLLNRNVDVFIPPWNALDQNTVYALEELGFRLVSHGQDHRTEMIHSKKIRLIAYSVEHLYFIESYTFRVMLFLNYLGFYRDIQINVLFHPYNLRDWKGVDCFQNEKAKFNYTLQKLNYRFNNLKKKNIVEFNLIDDNLELVECKNRFLTFLYKLETRRRIKFFKQI